MMSYSYFLVLIKGNTNNKLDDYKKLCRFCLENKIHGIDISDDKNYCNTRDAILNNYSIITKRNLPISDEYPNFVCLSCEGNLTQYADFARQIQLNAENWETFLQNATDVKECNELNPVTVTEIEEIKIECCDVSYDDVPNIYDALEPPALKIEVNSVLRTDSTAATAKRRKRERNKTKMSLVTRSTEFERTCRLCDEPTFSSLAHLCLHYKLKHPGQKIFSCDICGAQLNSKNALTIHMKERHSQCGRTHQCQFCAKLFYSDREVRGHEKSHLNACSYVCSLCGKGFNQKTHLNVHLKSKAHNAEYKTIKHKKYPKKNQSNKKIYRCVQCVPSTVFASSEQRADHRNAMHKIFECNICKNSFITQESLDNHKLLHSNKPRPFVCTVCRATFNQSSHLSSHFKRKHTDDKSFECSFCDKNFFANFELISHTNMVHKKQQRVKCDKCDLDFRSIKNLHRHTSDKHSTEASPYDCKICGKKNFCAATLEIHRLKHHKNDK